MLAFKSNYLFKISTNIKTSSLVKLSVQSFKIPLSQYPAIIQWARPIGFNSSSIIEGKTLTGFPSNILYQTLYISVIIGNCLVEIFGYYSFNLFMIIILGTVLVQ